MKFLYNNNVTAATITSLTEDPFYGWDTALNDPRLTRYGRTLGVDDQWILFTNAAAVDVDYVYISDSNITSGATVKIQGNATDVWTSPTVDQALTYDSTHDYWIYNFSTTQSYKYWRIFVDDPTNTDGYIQIGNIFIGDELAMPGMNPDTIIPYTSNAQVTKAIGGQLYGDRRVRLKGGKVTYPIIEQTQKVDIETMFDYVDLVTPFLVLFWEDSLDVEPPLYCTLTKSLEWSKNPHSGTSWTLGLDFEEVR